MGIELSVIWAFIIFFAGFMYVVMDGFDLGIGIMFPAVRDRLERDIMIRAISPVWDGNETWLVFGGATLMAAFPIAYAVLLTSLYLPLTLMLVGLIFRGVAFEFRTNAHDSERHLWDKAFFGGSVCAALFQGITLGTFLDGIPMNGLEYSGNGLEWIAPFPFFCGISVLVAYTLLGACWLIIKTENALQAKMVRLARLAACIISLCILAVSIWTPLTHDFVKSRWFDMPNLLWLLPVPALVIISLLMILRSLQKKTPRYGAFASALALIFLGYTGLAISIWPNIIPPGISLWDAAAAPQSQGFALVGALFIIPFILMYMFWSYYVFRGKVHPESENH